MGGVLGKMSHLTLSEDLYIKRGSENLDVVNGNFNTPKRNFIADELLDPRSATVGIKRTPLFLSKIEEKKGQNETPIKAKPYLETDLDEAIEAEESKLIEGDESVCSEINSGEANSNENELADDDDVADGEIVAVNENISEEIKKTDINESLITEHGSFCTPNEDDDNQDVDRVPINKEDDFNIITFEGRIMNSPAINKLKIATFVYEDSTPTSESTPVKPKNGRTPLGLVTNNSSPLPSPLKEGKQWRGFHEERIRLGLENTPPNSLTGPFIEAVQSAPGKVGARRGKKLTRTNWAQDESLII